MARTFVNASSEYIDCGAPSALDIATNAPMAVSAWANFASFPGGADVNFFSKGYDGTNTAYFFQHSIFGPSVQFATYNGVTHGANWVYGGALTTGVWYQFYGDYTGTTWHFYSNGVLKATSVDGVGPISTTKKFYIGATDANGTPGQFFDGILAECAVWNTPLDAGEIGALAKGYSAAFIRPSALLEYFPLVRNTVSPILGTSQTLHGTTVTAHPRIIMPKGRQVKRYKAVVAVVSVFMRPDADDTDGTWTNELGSNVNLFASIDEVTADDADYIQSATLPANDLCKIRLSNPSATPAEPFYVKYRYKKAGTATIDLRVRLLQGAAVIATYTHSDISTSFVTTTQTLSGAEFASITDFTDLFIEFRANAP